jgi:transcriptional regulator with XRE-family HTH domain
MTETHQQKIGRTVRKYRKEKKMSQQELADRVNIS